MKLISALVASIALSCFPAWAAVAEPQPETCDVPASFLESEIDLGRATMEMKDRHRLDITVIGSGSSALPGPDRGALCVSGAARKCAQAAIAGRRNQRH